MTEQEKDKVALLLKQVAKVKGNLHGAGIRDEAIFDTLVLLVDYIEFMLTPCQDED